MLAIICLLASNVAAYIEDLGTYPPRLSDQGRWPVGSKQSILTTWWPKGNALKNYKEMNMQEVSFTFQATDLGQITMNSDNSSCVKQEADSVHAPIYFTSFDCPWVVPNSAVVGTEIVIQEKLLICVTTECATATIYTPQTAVVMAGPSSSPSLSLIDYSSSSIDSSSSSSSSSDSSSLSDSTMAIANSPIPPAIPRPPARSSTDQLPNSIYMSVMAIGVGLAAAIAVI